MDTSNERENEGKLNRNVVRQMLFQCKLERDGNILYEPKMTGDHYNKMRTSFEHAVETNAH